MNKRIVGAVLGIVAVAFSSSVSGFAGPIGAVGDLYLTSPNSGQVQQFDGTTYAYVGPFTQAGTLNAPVGLLFRPDGNLLVGGADPVSGNNVVKEYDNLGNFIRTFAQVNGRDLANGPGSDVLVAAASDGVLRFDGLTGAPLGSFTSGYTFTSAQGIGFAGPSGNLFALDQIGTSPASRIVEFDGSTGVYIRTIATNLVFPFDLGVGPNGNVFATQLQAFGAPADVTEYDPVSGALVGSYDTPNSTFGIGLDFNPASGRLLASMRNPDGFAEFAVGGGYLNTYLTAGFQPNKIAFKVPEPATLGLLLVSLILAGRRH
ncbi:MAG: PEP-CTERM sorting domain-containing protein [Phycisphaerae bacterium]|nr:PEP-CTERM sorting domain-containing protein [Phycisphaerae bacterium]